MLQHTSRYTFSAAGMLPYHFSARGGEIHSFGNMLDGLPVEDIAKGIYLSILTRVIKLRIDPTSPIFLIGGVIAWHPYLKTLLQEKLQKEVQIIDNPQLAVSFGAALFAREAFQKGMVRESEVQTSTSNT